MPRFRLLVAYDGTDFHGWQRQEPPNLPALRTAQGVLTDAVSNLMRERVTVDGASRTDSGVHARGQVAAFSIADPRIPVDRMVMALNTRLPQDLEVRGAWDAEDSFDPIRNCRSKGYSYRLRHGCEGRPSGLEGRADPFERRTTAQCRHPLDIARMRTAAELMIGTHDFRSFAHCPEQRESTVRTVHTCSVIEPSPGVVRVDVAGGGFLYHMVRIMVGTLVEIGRGRFEPESVTEILEARNRARAGPTMSPSGLCLEWVHYGITDSSGELDSGAEGMDQSAEQAL